MPSLSIVIPTRNRCHLWLGGPGAANWPGLWRDLANQTDQDFEVIIVIDHDTTGTAATLSHLTADDPPDHALTLADVTAEVPGPFPASAIPDNIGFFLARGDAVLHLDDDLALDPGLVAAAKQLYLPGRVYWLAMHFCKPCGEPLHGRQALDSRIRALRPTGATVELPASRQLHWGAAWYVERNVLLHIGGHALEHAGYHATDTRLGDRLVAHGLRSFLALSPQLTCRHRGQTWYQSNKYTNPALVQQSRITEPGGTIANGGRDFWCSPWTSSSHRVLLRHQPHA